MINLDKQLFILIKNRQSAQIEDWVDGGYWDALPHQYRNMAEVGIVANLVVADELSTTGYRIKARGVVADTEVSMRGEETRHIIIMDDTEKVEEELNWSPGPQCYRHKPWNGKVAPVRNRQKKRSKGEYIKAVIAYRKLKAIKLNPMKATIIVDEVAAIAAKRGGNPNQAASEAWKAYC